MMKTIFAFIRKKNILFKIILSYSLVGFLFVTGFSYVILFKVSSELTNEVNETSARMIEQSYNTADILLSSTYNYYSQLFLKNEWINSAMFGNDFTPGDIHKINSQLNNFKQTNPLVSSIYVYNYNRRLVFSSSLTFSTIDNFFDKGMTDLLEQKKMHGEGIFIPRKATFTFPNSTNTGLSQNLISVIYSNLRPDGNRDSMIVNLDQNVLQQLVMKGSGEGNYQMMIVNDQGRIISSPEGDIFQKIDIPTEMLKPIMGNNGKRGSFITQLSDKNYMVSYVKADRLGWNFIILADYDKLLGKVYTLKSFILRITLLCLAIMAITSAFFTKIIYVPIYQLIKRTLATTESKDKPLLNEYDLLNKSFSLLESKVSNLQSDINQSVSARRQSFLRSILHGTLGKGADVQQAMKKLGLGQESDRYVVCVLKMDSFHEMSEKYDMVDISLLKYAIENISREMASSRYKLEVLEDGHDSLDLIFNIGSDDEPHGLQIKALLAEIQNNVEKFLKITVTASIGPVAERAEDLKLSRLGADQAVHFRLVYGTNSLISYEQIITEETKEYQYPVTLEKQMMYSLKAGELEQLRELSDEFFAGVHRFKYDEIILSLVQLLVMTIRTAKGMSSFGREDADLEIHTCQQQVLRLDTLEQIESWYLSLCERIIAIRDRESRSKNNKTVEKMAEYIKDHYTDPNLSVDMLAQLIGLSSSYVRKLFKEETGKSVAEHIAEHRFQKAQELLMHTDHPAKKIGEMVGFDNPSYFYVLFKKHVGMTPDHYRRENKLENMMTD
ncbi:AraC family transcriptional regulator [Paenibacillus sp. sptzw28]|uniref:helix-turn-helix domain-containing protein n=1 Tax=Paenibacillus sp. sptzw28 TaxID=715179 RepID=UPI001C6F43F7|nr:helix-turn-helix domain-containing protein [Paenibacillus sp. sptzw28]QYR22761.1 AraC family transcriptional regulator [Paenibacillus sp. sptzw28]